MMTVGTVFIGNARPRTDVTISDQTLRKQTWQHTLNLKTRKSRIRTPSIQTIYRNISLKSHNQLRSIIR